MLANEKKFIGEKNFPEKVKLFLYLFLRFVGAILNLGGLDWKAALNRFTIQFDERMPRV